MKKMFKLMFLVIAITFVLGLAGCGKQSDFDNVTEQMEVEKQSGNDGVPVGERKIKLTLLDFPEIWYNLGVIGERWFPVVWASSWVIAIILVDFGKEIMELKKMAVRLFGLKIPLVAFIVTYGYCAVYSLICF